MPLTQLLQSAGWPTDTLVIDFETYFDKEYSLKKMSTSEYVMDDRFEILGFAYKRNNEDAGFFGGMTSYVSVMTSLRRCVDQRTIIMHNAHFDALILDKLGIHCPYILDTRMMSRHVYARRVRHSLAALAKAYDLPAKGDTKEFMGLHAIDDLTDLGKYAQHDTWLEYQLALRLASLISNPEMELWLMNHTLNLFLKSPFTFDVEKATRIQALMDRKLQRDLKRADTTLKVVGSADQLRFALEQCGIDVPLKKGKGFAIPWDIKRLELAGDTQLANALKKEPEFVKVPKMNPCFSKTDPEYDALLHHENRQVRWLMQARAATKTWPTQIKRIETLKKQTTARGGRLPIYLNYYGAGTGRWSGGDGTNLQNLSKHAIDRLRNQIRGLICAPEGMSLVVVDASQIEARGVDWISGQEDYLELWRKQVKIYRLFATQLYGGTIEDITDNQRKAGKTGVLGCGFGMGAEQLVNYAWNTFKIHLTLAEARLIINTYRRTHAQVVDFWYKIEHAFKFVLQYQAVKELADGRLRIAWVPGENIMSIRLPNSRELYYHNPRMVNKAGRAELKTDEHPRLWGGVLTENVVQAISRDVLAENILALENLGFPISLHVHDEVVMCVPTEKAEAILKISLAIFAGIPDWAAGWPLKGEGKVMQRYGK